jgi:hypothetical protein
MAPNKQHCGTLNMLRSHDHYMYLHGQFHQEIREQDSFGDEATSKEKEEEDSLNSSVIRLRVNTIYDISI